VTELILENNAVEVDQQSERVAAQAEIGQELRFVNRQDLLDKFDLQKALWLTTMSMR
jgi:hypothetical protein